MSTEFRSIWPIDRTLSSSTTPDQSGSWSNGNEGVLCIPQIFSITGTSPSDCLASYTRILVLGGLTPQQKSSRCILWPQLTGQCNYTAFRCISLLWILFISIPFLAGVSLNCVFLVDSYFLLECNFYSSFSSVVFTLNNPLLWKNYIYYTVFILDTAPNLYMSTQPGFDTRWILSRV